jgi:hypothetical protein
MGTSKSLPTPAGGAWTSVKRDINALLKDSINVDADLLIADVLGASGGLGAPSLRSGGGGGGGAGRIAGGGSAGGGGGGGRVSTGRANVGRAVAGLGGFGATLATGGLNAAVAAIGLAELRGRPAAEVIARIAEHLAGVADGLQQELLNAALRDAIFEAAALEGDRTYENLEVSLQAFLARAGVEGLVECFLTRYVFDRIWSLVESHVDRRTDSVSDSAALSSAVDGACLAHVRALIEDLRSEGRFDRVDWFGPAGQSLGDGIVATLEFRLSNPET